MLITGVDVPVATLTGAVPLTEVTVPGLDVTVPQDVLVPSVVKYLPVLLVWLGRIAFAAPVVVVDPVPPLATGKVPVTPVVKGSPVQEVKVPEAGVPKAGVTRVGEVARTKAPEPVEVVPPVPPLATGKIPVTPVVRLRLPVVLKFEPPLARLLACVIM
jgi:hypothetical protein